MRFLGTLFFFLLITGCDTGSDKMGPSESSLEGNWIMEAAARDGNLTETLKGSYFKFQKPDELINNINRREMSFTYSLVDDHTIEQRGAMNLDYKILKFQGDTLILRTEIRDYDFQFLLLRDTAQVDTISIIES